MKKFISASAILLVFGCASSYKAQNFKSNRLPSQDPKVTTKIVNTTDTREMGNLCGEVPDPAARFRNQAILTSVQSSVVTVAIRYPDYGTCEATENDGSKGNWHGFYDEAGDKASRLAAAIKGVGKGIAPLLVPHFLNSPKPRSWKQFSDKITMAAQKIEKDGGPDAKSWTTPVLREFKEENMVNLGYAGDACKPVYKEESYEMITEISRTPLAVEIRVAGGKLLPNECEKYFVSFDGSQVLGRSESDFNKYYKITQFYEGRQKAVVSFNGARIARKPQDLIDNRNSTVSVSNGVAEIQVVHPDLFALAGVTGFAEQCKLSITATLQGKTGSFWNTKTATLKTGTFTLSGGANSTTGRIEGVDLADGQRPAVSYTTAFSAGCPYFSTTPSMQSTIGN